MSFRTLLGVLMLALTAWGNSGQAATKAHQYTALQVRQDIDAIAAGIVATHPDLSHSADPDELEQALRSLRQKIQGDRTRDEVWRDLATLNPLLADAHLFLGYSSWRDDVAAHLRDGGTLFPFEVTVAEDGSVRVASELGGAVSTLAGSEIQTINDVPAARIAQELLSRVHGDTPRFRSKLLSQRWWFFYWKVYGTPALYDFQLDHASAGALQRRGGTAQPAVLVGEDQFDHQFQFVVKPGRAAVMTINTFSWPDPAAFSEFTRRAFQEIKAQDIRTLVIDVRNNGGGDDAMWLEGLLPYLADKPYRWASRYKKVIKPNPEKGERLGQVLEGDVDGWIKPEADSPLRFSGQTYVLVGPATYSSTILFANTMQDFGFALIAGTGGSARSKQSGGVQKISLPNTGLVLWSPRFVLRNL